MTEEQVKKANKILDEKRFLKEELYKLRNMAESIKGRESDAYLALQFNPHTCKQISISVNAVPHVIPKILEHLEAALELEIAKYEIELEKL